jgi:DNA primase
MYLLRCNNRYEWFNFHYAHPYVLVDKKVYIFEAEKSCMKAFTYGIYNTVAIGASEISDEQIQIIKQIGLDIEIVLCYDKGIPKDEIEDTARRFTGRKVSIMYDDNDLLKDKDAPIDRGLDVWNKLVEENISKIEV